MHRLGARCDANEDRSGELLGELHALLIPALLAGLAVTFAARVDPAQLLPAGQIAAGMVLAFVAAPCALGAVALAGALHVRAPLAATAFLCVAGIADLRALRRQRSHDAPRHDTLAYLLLSIALGLVAWRHGDGLVHPAIALALGGCAIAALHCAFVYRQDSNAGARIAPAIMLLGALVTAPAPEYRATETTLAQLFPGERISFTGVLARRDDHAAIVRYAITCCRADAAPVALRLERVPPYPAGAWLHTDGRIERSKNELVLAAQRIERIAPPADPFIYR